MAQSFKLYRIVCTITGKALSHGSNLPNSRPAYAFGRGEPVWYERGSWSERGGGFWKTDAAVKKHLQNLCHDWQTHWYLAHYPRYEGERRYWQKAIEGSLDWSRLNHLTVEEILVTNYSTINLSASDFMGIPTVAAA